MKSPWDLAGRGQDDMEALQTDVMRFMAILGLCLAAIFSLVKSPDFNPPPEVTTIQAPEVTPEQEVEQPEKANPITDPEQEGFILEFESAGSLGSLVDEGRVTLVVSDSSLYWAWSGERGLVEVNNLSGYYAMEGHTVPDKYSLEAETKLGSGDKTWGVVLPASIITQIGSLVERRSGGVLVISSTGAVSLEKIP